MTNNRRLGLALLQYSIITASVLVTLTITSEVFFSISGVVILLGLVSGASVSLVFRLYLADSETYDGIDEFVIALMAAPFTSIMGTIGLVLYLLGDQDVPVKEDKDLRKGLVSIAALLIVSVALLSFGLQKEPSDREKNLKGTTGSPDQYPDSYQIQGFNQSLIIDDLAVTNGKLRMVIRNNQQSAVELNTIYISNSRTSISSRTDVKLSRGETRKVELKRVEKSETENRFDAVITYNEKVSDKTKKPKKITGEITGHFKLK